jgi:Raf kinase inhibitor-like YbhB/YbcL family protein
LILQQVNKEQIMNRVRSWTTLLLAATWGAAWGCEPQKPAAQQKESQKQTPEQARQPTAKPATGEDKMAMTIESPAFKHNASIPAKYTDDGENISPPLTWSNHPEGTREFALICDDPDAPLATWVHWVIYKIPASAGGLTEKVAATESLAEPAGALQGKNSWKKIGYGGPAPPRGEHRYFFRLYALDTALDVAAGLTKEELLKAMEGHILAEAELMGRYKR